MNLRFLLLSIIFLRSFIQVKAQVDTLSKSENQKLVLSISAGVAMPVGKFSTFEINPETLTVNIAGAAGMGYNGKFQAMFFFAKNVGVSLMYYTSVNKGEVVDSVDLFYDPIHSHAMSFGSYMTSYSYDTKDWHTNAILTGLIIVANKFNPMLDFRINAGVQKVQSPESQLSESGRSWATYWTSTYPYHSTTIQPTMSSYNVAINLGVDLQFFLGKKFGIVTSLDFLTSHQSFKGESIFYGDYSNPIEKNYYEGSKTVSFEKNIALINFNVGLSYALF